MHMNKGDKARIGFNLWKAMFHAAQWEGAGIAPESSIYIVKQIACKLQTSWYIDRVREVKSERIMILCRQIMNKILL
jgi:hypothetical protein